MFGADDKEEEDLLACPLPIRHFEIGSGFESAGKSAIPIPWVSPKPIPSWVIPSPHTNPHSKCGLPKEAKALRLQQTKRTAYFVFTV